MLKLIKYFLWLVVILALSLGFDQLMLQLPLPAPGLKQTQEFYVDFRSRLIGLLNGSTAAPADPIDAVISAKARPAKTKQASHRYLYVDADGNLQFADSLQQVPARYRDSAQPMAE